MPRNFFRALLASLSTRSRRIGPGRRQRPAFLALEERCLLATFQWVSATDGDFNNPLNWIDASTQKNGVPGPGDTAELGNSYTTVSVSQSTTVDNVVGSSILKVTSGTFTVFNTIQDTRIDTLVLGSGTKFQVNGGTALINYGTYAGTFNAATGASIVFGGDG